MRIAIGSLIHETDPGAPLTMMEAFALHREKDVLTALPAFVEALGGADIVPVFAAVSPPGGPLMRETFHVLAVELVHRLAARRPVDGVLLSLSGGLAIEDESDGNAELLERVRNVLPPGLPIAVALPPGASVTPRMRQPGVVFGDENAAKLLLEALAA
jgi:microcystin degradation protein MlrC